VAGQEATVVWKLIGQHWKVPYRRGSRWEVLSSKADKLCAIALVVYGAK
jgi:hypothetical protein